MDCLFCKIVAGEMPSHKIYEDDSYLAFLTLFPNTPGATVVIPKKHYSSYVFELPDAVYHDFLDIVRKVGLQLDAKIDDSNRTALIFEGFEIDHVHAKLYPLHGTADLNTWKPILSGKPEFHEKYQGYVTSIDGPKASEEDLEAMSNNLSN